MKVGERIRQIRKSINMTQNELAEKTNLAQSYISTLERDMYPPTIDVLDRICKALGCSLFDLLVIDEHDDDDENMEEKRQLFKLINQLLPEERKYLIAFLSELLKR